jgi:hypothetical protein
MKKKNFLISGCIILMMFPSCKDKEDPVLGIADTTQFIEKLDVTHSSAKDSTTLNAIFDVLLSYTDVQVTQNETKEYESFSFNPKPAVTYGDWFKIETLNVKNPNGFADAIKIVTLPNNTNKERKLVITLRSLDRLNRLIVTQKAN